MTLRLIANMGTHAIGSLDSQGESCDGRGRQVNHLHHGREQAPAFCASYSIPMCSDCPQAQPSVQDASSRADIHDSEDESDEDMDTSFF